MLEIKIPGFHDLSLSKLVLDYNGTLAVEGKLIDGIISPLNQLAEKLELHVLTGDTFGTARRELENINCRLSILPSTDQALAKLAHIQDLNVTHVVAIGNGRNDQLMLQNSSLSIAVLGEEGAANEAVMSSNIIVRDIHTALKLLLNPLRLIATLRN